MNILPTHVTPLEIIARSNGIPAPALRRLYESSMHVLTQTPQTMSTQDLSVSVLQPDGGGKVAVTTDMKSGWFVQLVQQPEKPILMTIGKKHCVTHHDHNTNQHAFSMFQN